jgi:hypothetical protein
MISDDLRATRSLAGRIGSAVQRSRHDPREYTFAGRNAFLRRFWPDDPALSPAEAEARAKAGLKAHMLKLALASAKARGARLAARRETARRVATIGKERRDDG